MTKMNDQREEQGLINLFEDPAYKLGDWVQARTNRNEVLIGTVDRRLFDIDVGKYLYKIGMIQESGGTAAWWWEDAIYPVSIFHKRRIANGGDIDEPHE